MVWRDVSRQIYSRQRLRSKRMDADSTIDGAAAEQPAELPDLERFTSYEDGDAVVVADRENPTAWIRADRVRDLEP